MYMGTILIEILGRKEGELASGLQVCPLLSTKVIIVATLQSAVE